MAAPTLVLRRGHDNFLLCQRVEDGLDPTALPLRFHDTLSALTFIRSCITHSERERDLRRWYKQLMKSDPPGDIFEQVARLIASEQLSIVILGRGGTAVFKGNLHDGIAGVSGTTTRKPPTVASTPLEDELARLGEATVVEEEIVLGEEEPVEKTWIEIELVDDEGKPVPFERYKLTLPDGSTKWGRTDDQGKARVEKLQPGTCQVTFPDRDEEIWTVE